MTISNTLRAVMSILIVVLGNLQAWDSDVPTAGLLIVLLVSIAIALPPVALLVPVKQQFMLGTFAFSLILLALARLLSPIPLPGLFLVLVPAAMGLIFTGILKEDIENGTSR
jgi:hypothetical protein